ncbi:TIGR02444 family protein [Alteromonas aestuariivivens]|uniref:TIGR02444 family protein n=1 Tax=Alteromonas aestuariivivens TaxID=1938339 RepID=A0A3D8M5J7_9ALTE|nr:TIGR02444 family protein [Alteromonas aestuariivivens]RDV24860.1 TIGR02444 family protein [Alteromonas aestuariivivens]
MNPKLTAETFWQFSLDWYAQPGFEALALSLQDEYGVNINMLLLLCWCMKRRVMLTLPQWQTLAQAISKHEAELKEHRQVRREAKGSSRYQSLKDEELQLESAQQQCLVEVFNALPVATASQTAFNPSAAGFIHLFALRDHKTALDRLKQAINIR